MASLSPLSSKLGFRRAKHLLRRTTFNYSKSQLTLFSEMTAQQAVSALLVSQPNTVAEPYDPYPTAGPDGYWTSSDKHPKEFDGHGRKRTYITGWWWYNAMNEVSLRHKLTFFLHTSFTVGKDSGTGYSTNFYDHMRLLDFYALGNIKDLAKKITLDNAMLDYLDNSSNNANNPNENYAREFLELFTILKGEQVGEGDYTNYTEIDVQQAARVFSGFKNANGRTVIDADTEIPTGYANKNQHDSGDKTFSHAFGDTVITGRNTAAGMIDELNDFVEMVFAQPATAVSYIRKLYRFFVKSEWSSEVENDIIVPLANVLMENDYDMVPVLEKLFASSYFYDADDGNDTDEIVGAIIKSPLQLISEVSSVFNVKIPNPTIEPVNYYNRFFQRYMHNNFMLSSGMHFYNPDSVAGYPAHYQEPDYDRHWFSSNTLIGRYSLIPAMIYNAKQVINNSYKDMLDTVVFVENSIDEPGDAYKLVEEIAGLLYPEAISEARINYFVKVLLDSYDTHYWSNAWRDYSTLNLDRESVKSRLDSLIVAMINAAEFQLM